MIATVPIVELPLNGRDYATLALLAIFVAAEAAGAAG